MNELVGVGSLIIILGSVLFAIVLLYFVPVRLWITAIFSGVKLGLFRDLVGMRPRNGLSQGCRQGRRQQWPRWLSWTRSLPGTRMQFLRLKRQSGL